MHPAYKSEQATLYRGDALAVLAELPTASVDAVIADPPYSSGGMVRGDRIQDIHTKYVNGDSISGNALPAFTGDNRDQRGFGYWCALWIGECMRILKPGGAIALFTDWRQLPMTSDALQAGGIVWRGIVPWHKPNGRRVQGRFANNCEYIVWGTNGPRALESLPNAYDGFFQVNTPREREHVTQKPVEIMRQLVRIAPLGGVVLDPFAGSGSTGVAALLEGRRFIGVELTDHYVDIAEKRLRRTQLESIADGDQSALDFAEEA